MGYRSLTFVVLASIFFALAAASPVSSALDVTVRDPGGAGVAGARVRVLAGDAEIGAVVTDERGRASLVAPPGRYRVEVEAEGRATARRHAVALTPGVSRALALTLEPGRAVGGRVVTHDGKPVPGARVVIEVDARSRPAARDGALDAGALRDGKTACETDAEGAFSVGVVPLSATYVVRVGAPGFASRELSLDASKSAAAALKISLPRAATIVARVVDRDEKPVAGAIARATDLRREDAPALEVRSGDDGTVRIVGVTPSEYRVAIEPASAQDEVFDRLEVRAGETLDLGTVRVREGVAIAGRVVDDDGEPIPGVEVRALRKVGNVTRIERSTKSTDDGRFVLGGLREDEYEIRAAGNDVFLGTTMDDLVTPPARDADIALSRAASVVGSVRAQDGRAIDHFLAQAWLDERGGAVGDPRTSYDDADPLRFRIDGLAPGRFFVTARTPGLATGRSEPFTVSAGDEVEIPPIELETGLARDGIVFEQGTRAPIAGASISVDNAPHLVATSDAQGRFRLEGLRAVQLAVQARHEGYAPGVAMVSISKDDETPIEIPLSSGGTVRGRVTRPDGSPVEGVTLRAMHQGAVRTQQELLVGEAITDMSGRYEIARVPAGVVVVERGGTGQWRDTERRAGDVVDGEELTIDFTIGRVVEGVVARGGVPLAGVRVALTAFASTETSGEADGNAYAVQSGWTDEAGSFRLGGVRPGPALFQVSESWGDTRRVVDIGASPEQRLDVALGTRPVTGRVVRRSDGTPVGANVDAAPDGARSAANMQMVTSTTGNSGEQSYVVIGGDENVGTRSRADGRFELYADADRALSLRASAFPSGSGSATVEPGRDPVDVTIEIDDEKAKKDVTIIGTLRGEDGSEIQDAMVCVVSAWGGRRSSTCNGGVRGDFRFDAIESGAPTTVYAVAGGYAVALRDLGEVRAPEGGAPLVVDLALGREGVVVVRLPPRDPRRVRSVMHDQQGEIGWMLLSHELVRVADEPQATVITIRALPQGKATITLAFEDGATADSLDVEIQAGATQEVRVGAS